MSKTFLLGAWALTLAGAASAVTFGVGGFGGVALPTGDMAYGTWGGTDMSSQLGVKVMMDVTPLFGLEAAGAYQPGYHFNHREEIPDGMDPTVQAIPLTLGANLKYAHGPLAVYGGGGGGYYLSAVRFSGNGYEGTNAKPAPWETTANVNAPGFYGSCGFAVTFGKFAVDVNPRYTYILNRGEYPYEYEWETETAKTAGTVLPWGSGSGTYVKDWNDSHFDILLGVDYYFM